METTLPGLAGFFTLYSWICFTEAHRLPCCCCSSFPLEFVPLTKLLPKRKEECWGRCQPQSPGTLLSLTKALFCPQDLPQAHTHTPPVAQDLFYNKQWLGDMNHPLIFFSCYMHTECTLFPLFLLELLQAAFMTDFHFKTQFVSTSDA